MELYLTTELLLSLTLRLLPVGKDDRAATTATDTPRAMSPSEANLGITCGRITRLPKRHLHQHRRRWYVAVFCAARRRIPF